MMDDIYFRDEKVEVAPAVDWSVLGEIMPEGIYFGMSEGDYHAAPALSNSGIKHLLTSPTDFWARSWMNPEREDDGTDAKELGKAYDCRIIEGRAAFASRYAMALDDGDYPNALHTADEIKVRLAHLGLKTSGKKDDLIARLLEADPRAQIWDTLLSEHGKAHAGRTLLSRELIRKIETAAAFIEKHPEIGKAFSGGYPQVSIFWTDESGVPMKSRLDYLKREAVVDLKTFSNPFGKPIKLAVAYAIASYKYHLQVAVYLEAVERAKKFIREGRVFGDVEKSFLAKLAAEPEHRFAFVFQQTGIAPVARLYPFPMGLALDCARITVRDAKAIFKLCVETFGCDMWMDMVGVETLDDGDFPAFMTASN